jgi:hypothetical protein
MINIQLSRIFFEVWFYGPTLLLVVSTACFALAALLA